MQKEEERLIMSNHVSGKIMLQGKKEDLLKVFGTFIRTMDAVTKELSEAFTFEETEAEITIRTPENAVVLVDDNFWGIRISELALKKVEEVWTLTAGIMGKYNIDLFFLSDMAYDFNLKGTAYAADPMMDWKSKIAMENKEVKKYGRITLSTGEYDNYLEHEVNPESEKETVQ